MELSLTLAQLQTIVVAGLALWMTLAVYNNIVDSGTNRALLGKVTSMQELKEDPVLGKGLIGRAVDNPAYPRAILNVVIVVQLVVVALLWRATWLLAFNAPSPAALGAANLALGAFIALWFWFLIGGLFYGYWMEMPQVQQVHLTLVIVAILAMLLVNLPR